MNYISVSSSFITHSIQRSSSSSSLTPLRLQGSSLNGLGLSRVESKGRRGSTDNAFTAINSKHTPPSFYTFYSEGL